MAGGGISAADDAVAVDRLGLGGSSLSSEHGPEIAQHHGVVGPQAKGFSEGRFRVGIATLTFQGQSEVQVPARVVGSDLDQLPEGAGRRLELALLEDRDPQFEERGGRSGIELERGEQHGLCLSGFAAAAQYDAELEVGFEASRIGPNGGAIGRLGLGKSTATDRGATSRTPGFETAHTPARLAIQASRPAAGPDAPRPCQWQ